MMFNFRLPSCMAISWSYIRSEFWLLWKMWLSLLFSFCIFLLFVSFFFLLKRRNWWNFFSFTSARLSACLSDWLSTGYPTGYLSVIWCFPIWLISSLSYQMAIFIANEIQTFLIIIQQKFNIRGNGAKG